jgi:hypothetical protein
MKTSSGVYQFDVWEDREAPGHWIYRIYHTENLEECPRIVIRKSTEWFESKTRAQFAAMGHISLLEKGEG